MVARIKANKRLEGAFHYNEGKVEKGVAALIASNGFWRNELELTKSERLEGLTSYANLNTRAKNKCVHISLNFDSSEKLSTEKLQAIAHDYMERIGFADQPYLVYEHFDAHHPHIHIVTTPIKQNRRAIRLNNIGKLLSEPARQQIEKDYSLVIASGRQRKQIDQILPVNIEKVIYSKTETKQAISNVVRSVLRQYRFTTIEELNAVLSQFNVLANAGKEGSRLKDNRGLLYCLLDSGKKVGVPIKASSISDKPTIKTLEKLYKPNAAFREKFTARISSAINKTLRSPKCTGEKDFIQLLKVYGIAAIFQKEPNGDIKAITYVDHTTKCVFDSNGLGVQYSVVSMAAHLRLKYSASAGSTSKKVLNEEKEITKSSSQDVHSGPSTTATLTGDITEIILGDNSRYETYDPYKKKKKPKGRDHGLTR